MIRRPPRSTLFPTRRSSDLVGADAADADRGLLGEDGPHRGRLLQAPIRSEEHTSELQSHSDLVCRLLLEKKKRVPSPGTGEGVDVPGRQALGSIPPHSSIESLRRYFIGPRCASTVTLRRDVLT